METVRLITVFIRAREWSSHLEKH